MALTWCCLWDSGPFPEVAHHREPGVTPQYDGKRQWFTERLGISTKKSPGGVATGA
jgi:hypothetical protein